MMHDIRHKEDTPPNSASPFLDRDDPIEEPQSHESVYAHTPLPHASTGKPLALWDALDHEPVTVSAGVYFVIIGLLVAIIAYAIISNSPLMAIVFILIGTVGYLSIHQAPETTHYILTDRGIIIGKEFYEYRYLVSFWVTDTEIHTRKELIIETGGALISHIFVPLEEQNVDAIRSIMLSHLPEKQYDPGILDMLSRILHI